MPKQSINFKEYIQLVQDEKLEASITVIQSVKSGYFELSIELNTPKVHLQKESKDALQSYYYERAEHVEKKDQYIIQQDGRIKVLSKGFTPQSFGSEDTPSFEEWGFPTIDSLSYLLKTEDQVKHFGKEFDDSLIKDLFFQYCYENGEVSYEITFGNKDIQTDYMVNELKKDIECYLEDNKAIRLNVNFHQSNEPNELYGDYEMWHFDDEEIVDYGDSIFVQLESEVLFNFI